MHSRYPANLHRMHTFQNDGMLSISPRLYRLTHSSSVVSASVSSLLNTDARPRVRTPSAASVPTPDRLTSAPRPAVGQRDDAAADGMSPLRLPLTALSGGRAATAVAAARDALADASSAARASSESSSGSGGGGARQRRAAAATCCMLLARQGLLGAALTRARLFDRKARTSRRLGAR
eukprot:364737-Chlamydomonas_euryale.AAC.11